MKMKFGKLLAAGKSWVGYPGAGRYQMREGLHLPKFISPKNPFKQEAVAASVAPSTVAAAPAMPVMTAPIAAPAPAPAPVETPVVTIAPVFAAIPVTPVTPLVPKVSWKVRAVEVAKLVGKFARSAGEWLKRALFFCLDHNPFSAIGRPKLAGIPRFGKSAVQGELSLDRVKVVRNDLSHADLEVVGQK
jgi:hypothetical protein